MDYTSDFVNRAIDGGSRLDYLELAMAALDQAGVRTFELARVIDSLGPDERADIMALPWVRAVFQRDA